LSTPTIDLHTLAVQAGENWARTRANELRSQDRPVVGGWPGTLKEATACVLASIAARVPGSGPPVDHLRELARAAYASARTTWLAVSERDEEP
jgi:hypothetical protein